MIFNRLLWITLVAFLLASVGVVAVQNNPGIDSLFVYYDFDNASVVAGSVENKVNASGDWQGFPYSVTDSDAVGIAGEAFDYRGSNGGSDYVMVNSTTNKNPMDGATTFSISGWFHDDDGSCTAAQESLWGINENTDGSLFRTNVKDGTNEWRWAQDSYGNDAEATSSNTYCDGAWHHIVQKVSGTPRNVEVWIDGANQSLSFAHTGSDFTFGSIGKMAVGSEYRDDHNWYWGLNGRIDEVALWVDRWLNQSEILWLNDSSNAGYGKLLALTPLITSINFTSDGGAICSFPTVCANTSDKTPTLEVITDSNSWVRMSKSDVSFGSMTVNCTGSNLSHTCTWPNTEFAGNGTIFYFTTNGTNGVSEAPLATGSKAKLGIFWTIEGFLQNAGNRIASALMWLAGLDNNVIEQTTTTNNTGDYNFTIFHHKNWSISGRLSSNVSLGSSIDEFIET